MLSGTRLAWLSDCKTVVFFANASDGPFSNERSGASEARALHTQGSRLRRFTPSENVRKRLFCSLERKKKVMIIYNKITKGTNKQVEKKHRHAKRARVIFLAIGSRSIRRTVHSNDLIKFFGGLRCTARRKLEIYNL